MESIMVVISNNGNHTGHNRIWTLIDSFLNKELAIEKIQEIEEENSDVKYGLTTCKIVTKEDIEEMKEEGNILINF